MSARNSLAAKIARRELRDARHARSEPVGQVAVVDGICPRCSRRGQVWLLCRSCVNCARVIGRAAVAVLHGSVERPPRRPKTQRRVVRGHR